MSDTVEFKRGYGVWAAVALFLLFEILALVFLPFGVLPPSLIFAILGLICLAVAVHYWHEMILEVDKLRVRLTRGGSVVREIALWDISKVDHGIRKARIDWWLPALRFYQLRIDGRRLQKPFVINTAGYDVDVRYLAVVSERIRMAASKTPRMADQVLSEEVMMARMVPGHSVDKYLLRRIAFTTVFITFSAASILLLLERGVNPLTVTIALVFSAVTPIVVAFSLLSRRWYCHTCDDFSIFWFRRGGWKCWNCGQPNRQKP